MNKRHLIKWLHLLLTGYSSINENGLLFIYLFLFLKKKFSIFWGWWDCEYCSGRGRAKRGRILGKIIVLDLGDAGEVGFF